MSEEYMVFVFDKLRFCLLKGVKRKSVCFNYRLGDDDEVSYAGLRKKWHKDSDGNGDLKIKLDDFSISEESASNYVEFRLRKINHNVIFGILAKEPVRVDFIKSDSKNPSCSFDLNPHENGGCVKGIFRLDAKPSSKCFILTADIKPYETEESEPFADYLPGDSCVADGTGGEFVPEIPSRSEKSECSQVDSYAYEEVCPECKRCIALQKSVSEYDRKMGIIKSEIEGLEKRKRDLYNRLDGMKKESAKEQENFLKEKEDLLKRFNVDREIFEMYDDGSVPAVEDLCNAIKGYLAGLEEHISRFIKVREDQLKQPWNKACLDGFSNQEGKL